MTLKDKRGQAHVEMILSFVLFISMLGFLIYMFPVYQPEKSHVGGDIAKYAVLNYADMNLSYFTIITNATPKSCFYIDNIDVSKVIVLDISGKKLNAQASGAGAYIQNSIRRVYQIYSSPYFIENKFDTAPCTTLGSQGISYQKGVKLDMETVSYEQLVALNSSYSSDYAKTRKELGIGDHFAFSFRNLSNSVIIGADRKKPSRSEVLAEDIPMQMFYSDGNSSFGLLNIQTW